ncbi:sel1 repeat family protein, partial [Salmonella enterica]|nr:sel1 repeat family protein [Salmonella enterica]EDP2433977.1 sel1 repeat family protein [Salmonella enterica subsp. enterica serovar Enteritidis]EEO7350525.1 sel1 repeat family protein [Salmonella enterica]EIZ5488616.1 sel1 repeat family protein [Salmonella enterica]
FKEADTSRNVIMGKLETKEIEKAKALSTEYIEKYHTNLNGDDTDRDKECKHLYP